MRLVQVSLLMLLVLLQYRFWFGDNGHFDSKRLDKEIAEATLERDAVAQKNDRLRSRVSDLKQSTDAIEELARQNLGLIKPGETFIMINDENL